MDQCSGVAGAPASVVSEDMLKCTPTCRRVQESFHRIDCCSDMARWNQLSHRGGLFSGAKQKLKPRVAEAEVHGTEKATWAPDRTKR